MDNLYESLENLDVEYFDKEMCKVIPQSTERCWILLKDLGIKEVDSLVEKTVNVGSEGALRLLEASLTSKLVLSTAFNIKEVRSKEVNPRKASIKEVKPRKALNLEMTLISVRARCES
ncbi:hypothetical protein GIB67_007602 [Kingdonia uniflora]|uniref:Uncharacterized protein n=1 Tax=Kingdonia uniflora TaxID=39325 RepID=A0A7J7N192_9MAGN|nr:hypothetical protein GIB67_007602 [Kingdonia uniflora]